MTIHRVVYLPTGEYVKVRPSTGEPFIVGFKTRYEARDYIDYLNYHAFRDKIHTDTVKDIRTNSYLFTIVDLEVSKWKYTKLFIYLLLR